MATKERRKVLAIDCEGTLLSYDGWKGEAHYGAPNPGMTDLLTKVREANGIIVIWTTCKGGAALRKHLAKYNIPFDFVNKNPYGPPGTSPKIFADVYLDDRAIRYEGKTEGLFEKIMDSEPWFEKKAS